MNNDNLQNIEKVVQKNGCAFCGTCEAVCPNKAISHTKTENNYKFTVDKSRCANCGFCLKVCPGPGIDYRYYSQKIFNREYKNENEFLLGIVQNCYYGYAKNEEIRYNSASGGSVSAFLIFLLERKYIDGAIVCSEVNSDFESFGYVAKSKTEILESAGSKYVPIPLNLILKEIAKEKGKKYAYVGLPCHMHGLVKFQELNKNLKNNIFIKIGLMCGQAVNFTGLKWFLKFHKINNGDIESIRFRGDGWPGKTSFKLKNKNVLKFEFTDYFKLFTFGLFTPPRCFFCADFTNEFSDISFADAWSKKKKTEDKKGTNIIIVRNQFADDLVGKASDYICLEKIDASVVLNSYNLRLKLKKQCFESKSVVGKVLGVFIPKYDIKHKPAGVFYQLSSVIFLLLGIMSNKYYKFFLGLPRVFWKIPLEVHRQSKKFLDR